MDVRINEVNSRVQTMDSGTVLDPHVMRQIVKACVKAVKEDQAREKRMKDDRQMTPGVSSDSE
ncbi:MAG TPA: hypothetical protein VI636_25295 [Candidatus Angelobacter sp.]